VSDQLKTAVTAVSLQVLKALARLWLDANVGAGEARALARLAHVLVAHEQAQRGAENAAPNITRIATKTGLSRGEVAALLSQAPDEIPPVKSGRPRSQAVLDGWHEDSQFLDEKTGRPAVLSLKRGRRSFQRLVRKHSGDGEATYKAILDGLLEAKAVTLVGRDGVRAVSRRCGNLHCPPEAIALLDELAWQLRALADNLKTPESRQYLRSIRCEDLDAQEAKVVLPELHEAAEDFAESARVTLQQAQATAKTKRVGSDTKRVTVLVQVLHEGEHPPKAATGGDARQKRASRSKAQARKKPSRSGLV
jgi:hypothetical protein